MTAVEAVRQAVRKHLGEGGFAQNFVIYIGLVRIVSMVRARESAAFEPVVGKDAADAHLQVLKALTQMAACNLHQTLGLMLRRHLELAAEDAADIIAVMVHSRG